ncbi:MAG: hypothetical protein AABY95_06680 [Pseudomonadota bacterium]
MRPRNSQGRFFAPPTFAVISLLVLFCSEVRAGSVVLEVSPLSVDMAPGLASQNPSLGAQWSIAKLSRADLQVGLLKDIRFGAELGNYETLKRWRFGIGFDFSLPASGQMHFNLYSRRNPDREGSRFRFSLFDEVAARAPRVWSLGLSVDRVNGLELTPQLVLRLDSALGLSSPMVLTMQYGSISPIPDQNALPERAVQVLLRWKF